MLAQSNWASLVRSPAVGVQNLRRSRVRFVWVDFSLKRELHRQFAGGTSIAVDGNEGKNKN